MLLHFTDAVSGNHIAVNPTAVVAVFTATEGEMKGKTVIGVTNGSIVVSESEVEVLGLINGELK